ncbi:helix-turn-helix transcriptional regulator, partial [Nonomuraea sp. NPDC050643]|uniref:helix-turn-helix domain-containing protein n=1 Tax=Nonomuraea sp. NPDC050643 TaxID=3155660 RepID=UPI0033E4DD63
GESAPAAHAGHRPTPGGPAGGGGQDGSAQGADDGAGRPPPGSLADVLTPQELRIAGLVADGLSSKEIAARLFLSPRTVEYHLYKIYPKLGIGTRTELARLVVLRKAPVAAQDML